MIPRILFRTTPPQTTKETETWWSLFRDLHPAWQLITYQDPIDPETFPITAPLWHHCSSGAQKAGLIRLEKLLEHGGFYVDSDVEPYRSFEPLVGLSGVAGWEDERVVPDAVLGACAGHPALEECLHLALAAVVAGQGAWASGPGVTTAVLPGRSDWLLLPPGSFYPYLYKELHRRHEDHRSAQPWAFAAHHWAASWCTPAQKAQISRQQRVRRRNP